MALRRVVMRCVRASSCSHRSILQSSSLASTSIHSSRRRRRIRLTKRLGPHAIRSSSTCYMRATPEMFSRLSPPLSSPQSAAQQQQQQGSPMDMVAAGIDTVTDTSRIPSRSSSSSNIQHLRSQPASASAVDPASARARQGDPSLSFGIHIAPDSRSAKREKRRSTRCIVNYDPVVARSTQTQTQTQATTPSPSAVLGSISRSYSRSAHAASHAASPIRASIASVKHVQQTQTNNDVAATDAGEDCGQSLGDVNKNEAATRAYMFGGNDTAVDVRKIKTKNARDLSSFYIGNH